jgi:hypothetical protein
MDLANDKGGYFLFEANLNWSEVQVILPLLAVRSSQLKQDLSSPILIACIKGLSISCKSFKAQDSEVSAVVWSMTGGIWKNLEGLGRGWRKLEGGFGAELLNMMWVL